MLKKLISIKKELEDNKTFIYDKAQYVKKKKEDIKGEKDKWGKKQNRKNSL